MGWTDDLVDPVTGDHTDSPDHGTLHVATNSVARFAEQALFASASAPALVSASYYDDVTETALHSCEATSNGQGTWVDVGGVAPISNPVLDTSIFNAGAGSVKVTLSHAGGVTVPAFFVNLAADVSVGDHVFVAFDFRYDKLTGTNPITTETFEVFASAAVNQGGTNVEAVLPAARIRKENTWYTVRVDVSSLSAVRCVGVRRHQTGNGGTSTIWIDNVRLAAATGVDRAYASAASVGVITPSDYSTGEDQSFLDLGTTRGRIDFNVSRPHSPGSPGVRSLREIGIDETGTEDVSGDINEFIDSLPDDTTVVAPTNALYRVEDELVLDEKTGFRFLGNGARMFATVTRNTPFIETVDCINTEIAGWRIFGAKLDTAVASGLSVVSGSPAVNGSAMELSVQSQEVRVPLKTQGFCANYARRYDGLNRFDFVLSDSAHVASDCVISITTPDGLTTLTSSTLTLTGTPTTYSITYEPRDLYEALRVTVKKATATANTITIASYSEYGRQKYDADHEFNHGVRVWSGSSATGGATRIVSDRPGGALVRDMWIEGVDGDAVLAEGWGIRVHDIVSRVTGRQGFATSRGGHIWLSRMEMIASGRHSIDIEPDSVGEEITDVKVENCRFYNPTLGGFAGTNFGRNKRMTFRNVDFIHTEDGHGAFWTGGCWEGVIENCMFLNTFAGPHASVNFKGRGMQINNIIASGGVNLQTGSNAGLGGGTVTSDYNAVRNWRAYNPTTLQTVGISNYNVSDVYTLGGSVFS